MEILVDKSEWRQEVQNELQQEPQSKVSHESRGKRQGEQCGRLQSQPGGARHSIFRSWVVSVIGFVMAVRTERNVMLCVIAAVIAVALSIGLRISAMEWIIVVLCIGIVLVTELLNTSIEAATDLACNNEIHPLAKIAKDTGAAATLIASMMSLIIAAIIFGPRIIALL